MRGWRRWSGERERGSGRGVGGVKGGRRERGIIYVMHLILVVTGPILHQSIHGLVLLPLYASFYLSYLSFVSFSPLLLGRCSKNTTRIDRLRFFLRVTPQSLSSLSLLSSFPHLPLFSYIYPLHQLTLSIN